MFDGTKGSPSPRFSALVAGLLAAASVCAACRGAPGDPDAAPAVDPPLLDRSASEADGDGGSCRAGGPTVVHFETDDSLRLEADLYLTGESGGPAVVLVHMSPPANDRHNYPPGFIDALVARGLGVLNVDRRGAGGSEGNPVEAYLGPNGWLDAKAARAFLLGHGCGFDPARIAMIGAANGTTTVVDYAVATAKDPSLLPPAGIVFLTGGRYTENQNRIADHLLLFEARPIQFVYAGDERGWSAGFLTGAPASWEFQQFDPGDHGTRIFAAAPASIDLVADFVRRAVGR